MYMYWLEESMNCDSSPVFSTFMFTMQYSPCASSLKMPLPMDSLPHFTLCTVNVNCPSTTASPIPADSSAEEPPSASSLPPDPLGESVPPPSADPPIARTTTAAAQNHHRFQTGFFDGALGAGGALVGGALAGASLPGGPGIWPDIAEPPLVSCGQG